MHFTKSLLIIILLACLAITGYSQRKRAASVPPSTPSGPAIRAPRKLVETVKTKEGREIHLYDDMTYDVAASTSPAEAETVEISIKAGVITGGGDVKPVARTEFTVFNEDIKPTLATLADREGKPLDVFGFYMADKFRLLDEGKSIQAALEKVKPTIVGSFTTDFQGNVVIKVPRSNKPFYLYGHFDVGRSSCMWYFSFVPDKNASIVLDNNNASYCG